MNAIKETPPTKLGGLSFHTTNVTQQIDFSKCENVTHNYQWLQTLIRGTGPTNYSNPIGDEIFVTAFEYVKANSITVFVMTNKGVWRLAGAMEKILSFRYADTDPIVPLNVSPVPADYIPPKIEADLSTVHNVLNYATGGFVSWDQDVYCVGVDGRLYRLATSGAEAVEILTPYENIKHIAVFENHLILADFTTNRTGYLDEGETAIAWSDLYRPEEFEPGDFGSEADLYSLDPETTSITGLSANRSTCYVFTPNNIFGLSYQPYPTGIRVAQAIGGLGATRRGSIVQHAGVIYFNHNFDFYALSGTQVQKISPPISEYFKRNANVTQPLAGMRAFLNLFSNNITWIFIRNSRLDAASHYETDAIIFSLSSGQWTTTFNADTDKKVNDLVWCSLFTVIYNHILEIGELNLLAGSPDNPVNVSQGNPPVTVGVSTAPDEASYEGAIINSKLLDTTDWPIISGQEGFKCSNWYTFFSNIAVSAKDVTLITNFFMFDSLVKHKMYDRLALSFITNSGFDETSLLARVWVDARKTPNGPENWVEAIRGDSEQTGYNVWYFSLKGNERLMRFKVEIADADELDRIEALTLSGVDTNPDEVTD